jgi:hypothetical protein
MSTFFRFSLLVAAVVYLSGCATGPLYKDFQASIPTIKDNEARLFFYRPEKVIGSGIRPGVVLNNKMVGPSTPGGFFFVDVPPGPYQVVLTSEVERKLTFEVAPKETKCIRLSVSLGILVYRVYPELTERISCEKEIENLNYITEK